MLEHILWNTAIVATTVAWIRFCDWKLKPWLEGRTSGNATIISTHETAALELFSLRQAYDSAMASPSLTADERARVRRAYLDKVRRMADRLGA